MIAVGPIAREEFAARVARVRERMVESGLDALVCYGAHVDYAPGDLRYLADWFCIEEEQALLIVPADGPITLLTDSSADVDRAREQAVCDEVVLAGDLGGAAAARLRGCSTAGLTGMRLLPAAAMDALRAGAPGVRLDDASALTAGLRMLKSPAEVALLAEAARISDLGMAAGLEAVGDGAREIEMAAAAEHAIRAAGAELSFTTVAGAGPRTALGTFLPGDRPMAAGEAVLLDCGARVHGYHGDMCRTVAVGEPPPELERALEAVAAAVEAGTAAARPGALVGRPPRGGARRRRRRRPGRGVVGRVHAARRGHRPARAALRRPRHDVRAQRGDGALHRARRAPPGDGRRGPRADGRDHVERGGCPEPPAAAYVGLEEPAFVGRK